ncbi:hypothetical protein QAD02_018356 [Eretmocerus hayati]|uniref:Uncharacterized protein n=1 Tax=Eretmocerus hayati TaxID=131215 RepID=A0ACC2PIY8_9HYME|nr:hypothetical protein QAD02_018356 [Eretmocerus hayati]
MLFEACNGRIHWVFSYYNSILDPQSSDQNDLNHNAQYLGYDTSILVDRYLPPKVGATVFRDPPKQYLALVYTPLLNHLHFYLLRQKNYEREISLTAILTFAGLFFTAWIFAVWAYLLGFKEGNWSFLNILTAQMGGSIEIRGRMRLSKMIYQMSIYVATFIVVTLGTDYMLEIFILRQYLPPIETIQDLADANIDLVMSDGSYSVWRSNYASVEDSSSSLQKVFNRTQKLNFEEYSFCNGNATSTGVPITGTQMSPNLCYAWSSDYERLEISTIDYQIDKIREPIISRLAFIYLNEKFPLKSRLEKVINKLSGAGMFENWKRNVSHLWKSREPTGRRNFEKNKQVPLQEQLWPVLAVGFPLGIVALICEFIWKLWIEKTKLGRLARAFYSRSRSNSVGWRNHFQENMRNSRSFVNRQTAIDSLPLHRKNYLSHLQYRPVHSAFI